MHLALYADPMCPYTLMPKHSSPISILKFQIAPRFTHLISSGFKKEEPKCCRLSKSPAKEPTSGITNRAPVERVAPFQSLYLRVQPPPNYDDPTYENPNLRSLFPKDNFDPQPTEFEIATSLRTFQFKLLIKLH